tara:strand:- start:66 stop:368 length:303 start_codon:yes stop_codon:yes gene_type:complete
VKNFIFEIDKYNSVNYLWTELIERFGFYKSKQIIAQAIDLQRMNGKKNYTMPIIFTSTGGLALISIDIFKKDSITKNKSDNKVLIFNVKRKIFQILEETK